MVCCHKLERRGSYERFRDDIGRELRGLDARLERVEKGGYRNGYADVIVREPVNAVEETRRETVESTVYVSGRRVGGREYDVVERRPRVSFVDVEYESGR